jgi:penicillin-binding protein 2
LEVLAAIAEVPYESLQERVKLQKRRHKFEPTLLLRDISRELVARISAARFRMPGIVISVVPARNYLYGSIGAHLIGYTREITATQLQSPKYPGYLLGDIVGQFGIEATMERYLRGQHGLQRIIVNSFGSRVGELSSDPEVAGSTLTLTLDSRLQRAADEALAGHHGAIVAIDVKTGEVLALASSVSFDPNVFTTELKPETWREIMGDHRLTNRAIQGAYPPGSVFKPFMEVAALQEAVTNPKERVQCNGGIWFKGREYKCHKKGGHGAVDLYSALVQSCDVYFYTMGQRLGVDRIHHYASLFGLGEKTGIDVADEASGLIPSSLWKRRAFRNPADQKWYAGETLSVSIGQGAVTTTPLQLARSIAAIVNGGTVMKPLIVKSIVSSDGRVVDSGFGDPVALRTVPIDASILERVKEGMVGVVNDPRGTGHKAQLVKELGVKVGGKTGTAQVVGMLRRDQQGKPVADRNREDHAWFVGYAPVDNPRVAVAALVEHGGHGGAAAAPLVAKVMTRYFDPDGGTVPVEVESSDSGSRHRDGSQEVDD